TANERRPVGDRFLAHRNRQIFTGGQHRRRRADGADRRHVNVLSRKRDQRTRGTGVGIDKRVSRGLQPVQDVRDLFGGVQPSAISIHFENDRGALRYLRLWSSGGGTLPEMAKS